jgi:hypothetical protein
MIKHGTARTNSVSAEEYNKKAMAAGVFTHRHIARLIMEYQVDNGLVVDGKAGPETRAHLERASSLRVQSDHWLSTREDVRPIPIHPSWYGGYMSHKPLGIMAHYTATDPNPKTALSLATRRKLDRDELEAFLSRTHPEWNDEQIAEKMPRNTSWHVTIGADGTIYQMMPFNRKARHCGSGVICRRGYPNLTPNECLIGIELEGHGDHFPEPQVAAARDVWKALVGYYRIPRDFAMLEHSKFSSNRSDPGEIWMGKHADDVLDYAFGVLSI